MSRSIFKYSSLLILITFTGLIYVHAAPLDTGFALAPAASASNAEKNAAYQEARLRVLGAAARYEKTPYRYGGIDRKGLDCSGFVYVSFKDALAVSVPRSTSGLYAWVEKINSGKLQPGDLVFFKTDNSGKVSHVGIYVGNNRFIHSASAGPNTGVIYSTLDERYWAKAYLGSGRALPPADINNFTVPPNNSSANTSTGNSFNSSANNTTGGDVANNATSGGFTDIKTVSSNKPDKGSLMVGLAVAPSWKSFLTKEDSILRGVAGQVRLGAETHIFPRSMIFGMELRPEWDIALGVFRLPVTLSWGLNDKLRFFAGAAFSFGDAVFKTADGERHYASGNNWLGAAGITVAPVAVKISRGELAPYGEFAWQSYFGNNADKNVRTDLAANFRFSTGVRYTWKVF